MKIEAGPIDAALVRLLDQLEACRAALGWCLEVPPSDPEVGRVSDTLAGVRSILEDAAEAVYDAFERELRAERERAGPMTPAERAVAAPTLEQLHAIERAHGAIAEALLEVTLFDRPVGPDHDW